MHRPRVGFQGRTGIGAGQPTSTAAGDAGTDGGAAGVERGRSGSRSSRHGIGRRRPFYSHHSEWALRAPPTEGVGEEEE